MIRTDPKTTKQVQAAAKANREADDWVQTVPAFADESPIGLSSAPTPPNLRQAKATGPRCDTCKMFDDGVCWGYGNHPVKPDELCDSWARETVKTLALADHSDDPGRLLLRATLAAQHVAHHIWQAVHRGRLQGLTSRKRLRQAGEQAGLQALRAAASSHAGGALNSGRHAAATLGDVVGARYTSILDKNTCATCAAADDGVLRSLDDPGLVHPPNPLCAGGDRCRCILVYVLREEGGSAPNVKPPGETGLLPPDDFPREPRQPDRPSGVGRIPVAQVGVGGS